MTLKNGGVPADCPEVSLAIQLIEQAKDTVGRALIHAVGKVKGVPFEEVVKQSLCAD